MFNGEGYHYWKTRMQIFIEAIDLKIWEAIEFDSFIPTMVERNATRLKNTREVEKKKLYEDMRTGEVHLFRNGSSEQIQSALSGYQQSSSQESAMAA